MNSFRMELPIVSILTVLFFGASYAFAFVYQRQAIEIPMRDGETLAADRYLPAEEGKWPVILIQTPYNKNTFALIFLNDSNDDPLLKCPDYAFVVLDWRGFWGSKDAKPKYNRGEDGYDAVEWIADRSWCDNHSRGTSITHQRCLFEL